MELNENGLMFTSIDEQLNMSLDDMVQRQRETRGGGRSRRGGKSIRSRGRRQHGGLSAPYNEMNRRGGVTDGRRRTSGDGGGEREIERRVYVGNLSWNVTWKELKDYMKQIGHVVHADVLMYRDGRSSGGGIVEYASIKDAKRAIEELNDTMLDGREIFVREDRVDGSNRGGVTKESRSSSSSGSSSGGGGGNRRCYVGNLPWSVDWKQLKDHMRKAGHVVHADVLRYRNGKSSGGGIVEYSTVKEAKRAIRELNDTTIDGRGIFVREDKEPASAPGAARGESRSRSAGAATATSDKRKRLFVGNLPFELTWQELKDHMRKAGRVVRADIINRRDGKASGGGIVEYETVKEAKRAIRELNDTTIGGRGIIVREDRED